MIAPRDSWTLARLLGGQTLNGELQSVSTPLRRIADHLADLPPEARHGAFNAFLCSRTESEAGALSKALAVADPEGPAPEVVASARPATLADVQRVMTVNEWVWSGWLPTARLAGIAAPEGIGKTRFAMDLSRRIWFATKWPDGQLPTQPEQTPTLWLCADGQQDELVTTALAFGMPLDSVYLLATPDHPHEGANLDDSDTLTRLESYILDVHPALVFVDTLTFATTRDICRANECKALMAPLRDVAQRTQTTIVPLLHVSKEGQALGRRIKGLTRTLMHLECPDPEQPTRLRLWMEKTAGKRPPELGVTMGDDGNTYDHEPPTAAMKSKGGAPPEKLDAAIEFLVNKLTERDRKQCELVTEWEKSGGGSKGTLFNAITALAASGRIIKDDSRKPKMCRLVKSAN